LASALVRGAREQASRAFAGAVRVDSSRTTRSVLTTTTTVSYACKSIARIAAARGIRCHVFPARLARAGFSRFLRPAAAAFNFKRPTATPPAASAVRSSGVAAGAA
jgi:hypothetical protein